MYAFFGSRGLYAYDLDGNLKWKKEFDIRMETRNGFGEGIAPTLYKDTLILSFDHHGDPDFIVAIDTSNGEERWRTPRQEITNWIVEEMKACADRDDRGRIRGRISAGTTWPPAS